MADHRNAGRCVRCAIRDSPTRRTRRRNQQKQSLDLADSRFPLPSTRLRAIALTGAVAIVLLALVTLAYVLVAGKNITAVAPIILGFATPTVTTLLMFGTFQNQVNTLTQTVEDTKQKVESTNEILTGEHPKVGETNNDNKHNH